MTGPAPTRLEQARLRAAGAKRAVAGAAAATFVVALVLARASHPGHSGTASTPASSSSDELGGAETDDGLAFDFGSGAIAPSGAAAPGVQSSVS